MKTEVEILRHAINNILQHNEIILGEMYELSATTKICKDALSQADQAKVRTFTIEEVEKIIKDVISADDLIVECPNTSYLVLHWTNWQQKKKQLLGEQND
ncbi:MAG: hypothetical protein ACRCSZ_06290 [Lactococcus lactis]